MTLEELGRRFVALGRALQDDDATLREITQLSLDCGVRVQFRLVSDEPNATAPPAPPPDSDSRSPPPRQP